MNSFRSLFKSDLNFYVDYCNMEFPFPINNVKKTYKDLIRFFLTPSGRFSFLLRLFQTSKLNFIKKIGFWLINLLYSCDISSTMSLGKHAYFPHPFGIVIGGGVVFEGDVIIFNNTTFGKKRPGTADEMPKIHSNVLIGAGARILGGIKVENNSIVAANAVLFSDLGPNQTYLSNGSRRLGVYWTMHERE